MDLSFRHDFWLRRLPRSPTDAGRLERIVVRPANGARAPRDEVEATPEHGLAGDRWSLDPARRPGNQVSLINVRLLRAIGGDDAARMDLVGDNLHVDLDLSERNLPAGTLLTIGEVVLEVTPDPHRPCKQFVARFGALAAKRVARGNRIGLRARGVLTRVVRGGTLRAGSPIAVRRPGAACLS